MTKNKTVEVKGDESVTMSGQGRPLTPFGELDQLMGSLMRHQWPRLFTEEWSAWPELAKEFERPMPRVDVEDCDGRVVVTAEIPGVKKDDLEVSVLQRRISIKGVTSHEEESEKGEYHRREIRRGEFARTIALPADVDPAQAKASFENGVLTVTLPKLEQEKRMNIKVE